MAVGGDNMSQPPGFNVFQDWQHQGCRSLGFASLFDEYQRLVCSCLLHMTQNEAGDPSPGPVLSEALGVSTSPEKVAARHITFSKRDFTEFSIMEISYSNYRIRLRLYRGARP